MRELKLTLGSYVTRMINNDNGLWRKKIITNSTPGPPAHVDHVVGVEETELLLAGAQTLDSENMYITMMSSSPAIIMFIIKITIIGMGSDP